MPSHANRTLTPPTSWEEFEDMLCDLFREVWKDPMALKNGRFGQPQNGVDVYGQPERKDKWAGVQAKKKNQLADSAVTEKELEDEVNKAKIFEPKLCDFILATTGRRDQNIQRKARLLTEAHQKEGSFRVHVYSWEDIETLLNTYQIVCKLWYSDLFAKDEELEVLNRIEDTLKEQVVESTNELKSSNAALSQQVSYLTSSLAALAASGAGSQKVYQVAIDQANALLDQFKPKTALAQLESLRKDAWDGADQITRWTILTNIGAAKFQLSKDEEAARLLIEAAQYNRDDEKALSNLALAYLLLDNLAKAEQYIDMVLQKNAANERAYALRVRVQSLRNVDFDSIVEQIPEEFRNFEEIASALGDAAGKYGDLQKCQYWFQIAYKSKEPSPGIATTYATSVLLSIVQNKLVLTTGTVSKVQKTQLENIIDIYTVAYTKVADSEHVALKLDCLFNRGVAWRVTGNYEKAAKDFDLASELDPENEKYIFHRANLAGISGKKDIAIALLEKIKDSKTTPATILLAEIYKEQADSSKGREILTHYLKDDPPTEFKEQAQRLLIELLITLRNYDEADKESAALIAANQENIMNLLIRVGVLKTSGKEKEAQEQLSAAQRLISKDSPLTDILALADQYYANKDFENAISLYESIADISVDNFITRNLLNCYYQSGREKEALNICTVLRQNYGPLKIITEIEAQIYEGIGNLEKAKEVCVEYLTQYPDDLRVQIRIALIDLHQQNFAGLDSFLKKSHSLADASLEDRIHLSQLLSYRGFGDQALDLMYETRRTYFDASEAHIQYITIFFKREKEQDHLLEVENVAENTAVYVNEGGGIKRYIIENRPDADFSKDELTLTHPLVKRLLGKKAGDTVVLSEGLQRKVGVIQEVKSKYVDALHKSTAIFETYFPDAQGFSVLNFTIAQNPDNEETVDFTVLFGMVDRQYQHLTQVLDLYKNGPLTIGVLAKLLHRNPIEAWGLLINKPDIGVRCAIGDQHERAESKGVLNTENLTFVVDITTLMTLHGLDVANEVVEAFGKMVVAQSTIDQITQLITIRKVMGEKPFMTVGKEGETYVREKVTAEQIQKNSAYLQAIFDWIQHNCLVIPCEEALTLNASQRRKLYDHFGADAIDSVLLARQEKGLLVSDDEQLRRIAKVTYGVAGAWTQALLEQMLGKDKIDNITYQKMVIKLVHSNYRHTRITPETLEEAANQSSWRPDRQFKKVAGVLSGRNSDDVSAARVASDFIFKLYTQQFFFADPAVLLFTILDLLFASRKEKSKLLAQLIALIQGKFIWLPALQIEIVQQILIWSRSQPLY